MPTISAFYGILIQIFWREHGAAAFPRALCRARGADRHPHARSRAGSLPKRALALVLEWASEHRAELMEDWDLCSRMQTPKKIEPLS